MALDTQALEADTGKRNAGLRVQGLVFFARIHLHASLRSAAT